MSSVFGSANFKNLFNNKLTYTASEEFQTQLDKDMACLEDFAALASQEGANAAEVLESTMVGASAASKQYAESMGAANINTEQFALQQRQADIAAQASNNTLVNVKQLINTYNNGYQKLNVSQSQFREAVAQTNPVLGRYLAGLNGADATLNGYIGALVKTKVATVGLKVATMALNMALTMGLAAAIQGVISGLDYLINYREKEYEAAKEASEKAKERADALVQEGKTLEELIANYKSLKEAGDLDTDSRTKIQDIQKQIVNLVGDQAKNLDLVNGKLKTQLNLLHNISTHRYSKNEMRDFKDAYDAAVKQADSYDADQGGWWLADIAKNANNAIFYGNKQFTFDYWGNNDKRDQALKAINEAWQKRGYGNAATQYYDRDLLGLVTDSYGSLEFSQDSWNTRLEALNLALETIRQEGLEGEEIYTKIKEMREEVSKNVSGVSKALEMYVNAAFNSDTYNFDTSNVKSIEDFEILYNNVVKQISKDSTIKDALKRGYIDKDWITEQANNYLSSLDQFSDIYTDWYKEIGSKTARGIQDLKDKVKAEGFTEWIDSLTDEDKEIVYKISVDADYAKWTLKDWEKSLEDSTDKKYSDAVKRYNQTVAEAVEKGVDVTRTVYGNIDTNNRQILNWTTDNLEKYKNELLSTYKGLSWKEIKDKLRGSFATVEGNIGYFDSDTGKENPVNGIPIAFAPILQTKNGAVYLGEAKAHKYIGALIEKAVANVGTDWSPTDLLKLDAEGLEIDGQKIKNILAGIGDEAELASESMHYVGNSGALVDAYESLLKYGSALDRIDISKETEGIKDLNTAISESASATGLSADAVSKLISRYESLDDFDQTKLFEYTSTGIHLNTEELNRLERQVITTNKALNETDLYRLIEEYNGLQIQISNCTTAEELARLYSERDSKYDEIQETAQLSAQYEALTSAYNEWQNAKSNKDERESYATIGDEYSNIKGLIDQGWVNDTEVTKYLDLLLSSDQRTKDNIADFDKLTKKIGNTGYSIMDFWQYDDDNKLTSQGLFNFLDTVNKELGDEFVKIGKDGAYYFNFTGEKVQKVADALGMSKEAVVYFENALKNTDFAVEFEGITGLIEDAGTEAERSLTKLKKLKKQGIEELADVDLGKFNLESTDIDDLNDQITEATTLVNKFPKNKDGTINLDVEGAQEARDILVTLMTTKQQLSQPAVLSIDTAQLRNNGKNDLADAIDNLKLVADNANLIEIGTAIGEPTTESQKAAKEAAEKITPEMIVALNLSEDDEKKVAEALDNIKNVDIDAGITVDQKDIDVINTALSGIDTKDLNIGDNADDVQSDLQGIQDFTIDGKHFSVVIDGYLNTMLQLNTIKSIIDNIKNGKFTISANITQNGGKPADYEYEENIDYESLAPMTARLSPVIAGLINKGFSKADGTVSGRSFANGSKYDGKTLGGELGAELWVDRASGRWTTVGENGAEFFDYRKGDIVFNAEQTKQLLNHGRITSGKRRGQAMLSGTAMAPGNGAEGGGSNPNKNNTHSVTDNDKYESKDGSDKTKTKTPKDDKKDTPLEKFQAWFSKLFDWIEIKLQRQTDRINKYISRAEKAQERKSYKTAISNYRKGIDATTVQIGYEQTANTKYNSQANKILKKAISQGLVSSKQAKAIAKRVKNGSMDISEYGEKVREVISDYQTWYNKAKDAKDAIEELHENIRTYISDLKAVRDAQRETKLGNITYRSDIATSSNADTTAASNNQLSYTNTQLDNQTGAYSTEISNTLSDRNNLAKKATKAISKAKKGKNKQYKKALKDAKKAIKKRKPVPSGTLSVIRKNNRKLYEKIYAYNLSLDNIETAREEYATVAATNIAEQYANREAQYENTRQQISDRTSLAESQMNNVTGTARNVYLDTIASNYASATQTSQNAVNSFQKSVNNQSAAINKNFKGSNFSKVSKSTRKAINNTIAKIRGITKAKKKVIDASLMDKLATYIKKGYVKQSFYTACLRYNNAIDSLIEANAQLEIDKAAEEANKLEDASARVANIQTDYSNKRNGITINNDGSLAYGATAQINRLQSEQSVRTSAGKVLKRQDYIDLIRASQEEQALFNAEAAALQAQIEANLAANPAYANSQNYIDDMAALEEARQGAENAEQAQNEWNASIANLPTDSLDRAVNYLDSILGYLQSIVSLKQALHETLEFDDYNNQIERNKDKIDEYYNSLFGDAYANYFAGQTLEEVLDEARDSVISSNYFKDNANNEDSLFYNYTRAYHSTDGYFGDKSAEEWLQEIYNKYADINGLLEDNIKLHSELVDNVYLAKYTKAIELLSKTEDLLSGISSIVMDEMKVDENGFITDYGMLALATTVEELENARQQVSQYSEEINELNRRLADGTITQVEYDDRINDVRKSYLDAAKSAEDYAKSVVDVYKSQAQAEVDALNEVIKARQEALNKKKAYYDYDSSLKEKTKDIRELEAELAALEGIETAAGKAKAAQLRADLAEKQDDLNDTLREHAIELSDNALSEMSESIQKAFDDYWKKLWNNMDDVKKLLAAAIDDSGSVNKSELINSILKGFGLSGTYESTGINTHYASGTKYVPHNLTAMTNEKGREAIVTKNGIILPLLQGEGVIPADLTERLFALASSDLPLGKIAANGNGTNIDVHYDNLINIEGSADAATVEDLKRFSKDVVKQSYEYTSSKLYKGYVGSGGKRKI